MLEGGCSTTLITYAKFKTFILADKKVRKTVYRNFPQYIPHNILYCIIYIYIYIYIYYINKNDYYFGQLRRKGKITAKERKSK